MATSDRSKHVLCIGIPVRDPGTRRYFNSLVSLGDRPGVYHKRHLVPFGDYVPLQEWLRGLIRFFDLPMSGFSPGPAKQRLLEAELIIGQSTGPAPKG
mgnify:CR=1 FL=1